MLNGAKKEVQKFNDSSGWAHKRKEKKYLYKYLAIWKTYNTIQV